MHMCVARRAWIWRGVKFAIAIVQTENIGGDSDREILPGVRSCTRKASRL